MKTIKYYLAPSAVAVILSGGLSAEAIKVDASRAVEFMEAARTELTAAGEAVAKAEKALGELTGSMDATKPDAAANEAEAPREGEGESEGERGETAERNPSASSDATTPAMTSGGSGNVGDGEAASASDGGSEGASDDGGSGEAASVKGENTEGENADAAVNAGKSDGSDNGETDGTPAESEAATEIREEATKAVLASRENEYATVLVTDGSGAIDMVKTSENEANKKQAEELKSLNVGNEITAKPENAVRSDDAKADLATSEETSRANADKKDGDDNEAEVATDKGGGKDKAAAGADGESKDGEGKEEVSDEGKSAPTTDEGKPAADSKADKATEGKNEEASASAAKAAPNPSEEQGKKR